MMLSSTTQLRSALSSPSPLTGEGRGEGEATRKSFATGPLTLALSRKGRGDAKRWLAFILFSLFLTLLSLSAHAQVTTPRTETTLISDKASVTPGETFWAVLHIKLKDGWHTYWKNPGDSGTTPTLDWTLPSGFTAGEIQYQPPERLASRDEAGKIVLMDYGYNNDAYYLVPITAPALLNENATIILMVKAQWLVCKDTCIPEKAELSLALPVTPKGAEAQQTAEGSQIDSLVKNLPQPIGDVVDFEAENGMVRFHVKLPKAQSPQSARFYPLTDGIIANNADQQFAINDDVISLLIPQGENKTLEAGEGVLSVTEIDDYQVSYAIKIQKGTVAAFPAGNMPAPQAEETHSLLYFIVFAFLGGLILNLMPCVLPILSLKVLSIMQKGKAHASTVRKQALAYTFGVVLSFMLLALLLLALQKVAGESLGWGFQMQSPVFVALLSILMLLVGLNLSGAFELPVLFGSLGSNKASQDNALGSFLTGVLAVMVATPCSAPFMAPAIGFALTQQTPIVLAVFASLGLGLAAPFLLFSLFPRLARLLPRPGAWMLVFKQFLAFPIYLTAVWLLWVLAGQAGANGVGIAMLGMVAAGFSIFLLQRQTTLLWIAGFVLAGATIWGVIVTVKPVQREQAATTELSEPFSIARIDALRKEGKAVFVDATADWCITCKVNEQLALNKPEVKAAFAAQKIVMMIADYTSMDKKITEYLDSFGRSGVPLYVYYPANGSAPKVLPQLLTPSIVLEAIHE